MSQKRHLCVETSSPTSPGVGVDCVVVLCCSGGGCDGGFGCLSGVVWVVEIVVVVWVLRMVLMMVVVAVVGQQC